VLFDTRVSAKLNEKQGKVFGDQLLQALRSVAHASFRRRHFVPMAADEICDGPGLTTAVSGRAGAYVCRCSSQYFIGPRRREVPLKSGRGVWNRRPVCPGEGVEQLYGRVA